MLPPAHPVPNILQFVLDNSPVISGLGLIPRKFSGCEAPNEKTW